MTRTKWSAFKLGFAALLVAALSVFAFAPASAHDQLVSSNPEDGAELDQQPEWLEMTFSGNIQEVGSEVTVVVDGKDVSAGELTVEGKKLSVALPDDLKPGDYEVTWRVVSQDGHPISGDYAFTIKDSEGAGGAVEESTKAGLGGGVVDEPGKDTGERGEIGEASGSDSGMSTPMIVLLSVGGLAIIVIVVLLMRRKAQGLPGTKGDDSSSGPGPKND
ncbi:MULTISPECIES: copper resistance CopC family protein [unclassified Brevibacterium]|uniref:copper resistance CopC family protein n=1 Tax=unclassified Brevibacterium TaxID=2614124 RepID=UPI0010803E3D|nr:copper resistance protein CopC [Brevibacterium sp. S111]TGD10489.1 copper resistance protein CopC [Brevibacterium sp. S111]